MQEETAQIKIGDNTFSYIKTRVYQPVSIYKDKDVFLRIGERNILEKEINFHKNLIDLGFPVPKILAEGEYEGKYYFTESSLGEDFFSNIFKSNNTTGDKVSDSDFNDYLQIIEKFALAQIKTLSKEDWIGGFEQMIHLDYILRELPDLKEKTALAVNKFRDRTKNQPGVLTHGDFTSHNIFPKGVIDWERAGWAGFGYDLVTACFQTFLFPKQGDFETLSKYSLSLKQIEKYWQQIDTLCQNSNLLKISPFIDDFLFFRIIWSVVRMERYPKLQKRRYELYSKILDIYLKNESVQDFLVKFYNQID